jgi:hypothetical protein
MRQTNITKGIVLFLLVLTTFITLLYSSTAIGLAPSRTVIDFTPNLEQEQTFRIINTENKDMSIAIYPQGELAEYIVLENKIVDIKADEAEKTIKYRLNLPKNLEPGTRSADLVQLPGKDIISAGKQVVNEQNSIVTATVVLVHQLKVNVPYPGKYAQGRLYISSASANEVATFTISLFNQGKEQIKNAKATVVIKGPTGEEIAVIKTNEMDCKCRRRKLLC